MLVFKDTRYVTCKHALIRKNHIFIPYITVFLREINIQSIAWALKDVIGLWYMLLSPAVVIGAYVRQIVR